MNEVQKPTDSQNTETTGSTGPMYLPSDTGPVVSEHKPGKAFKLAPKMLVMIAVPVVLLGGAGAGWYYHKQRTHNSKVATPTLAPKSNATSNATDAASLQAQKDDAPKASPTTTPKPTQATTKQPTATTVTPKPSTTPTTPAPATPNTTNCLPQNPSIYDLTYTNKTNSQYLQTNSYINSTKFYAGLQFAGLASVINTKQYVVLAMDDSEWNSLTPAQLNFMNASPANMKSVLGWQIITKCITYDGVNPVKDLADGATQTITTVNGTVTFTAGAPVPYGIGQFASGQVHIWDWFTSNGAVTIAGFVKPPQ